jgi:DNA-binding transcriptional LysR family regulator
MQQGRIEAFLAVADAGNMSRAAEELCLTQPALSARLKALEDELQVELFARSSRGMRLTEAGRAFRPYAERSVAALREGQERLRLLQRGGGMLLLASAPGVSTYTLPALLERFTAAYPHVLISVRTGHSEDVLEMVLREEAQLGLAREIRHPDIERVQLYEDELALVVGPHHPWALQRETAVAALGRERIILFDRSSSYYELTRSLLLSAGWRRRARWSWTTSRRPSAWSSAAWEWPCCRAPPWRMMWLTDGCGWYASPMARRCGAQSWRCADATRRRWPASILSCA